MLLYDGIQLSKTLKCKASRSSPVLSVQSFLSVKQLVICWLKAKSFNDVSIDKKALETLQNMSECKRRTKGGVVGLIVMTLTYSCSFVAFGCFYLHHL